MNKSSKIIPNSSLTKIRVYLQIPAVYHQTPVIYKLISNYGLVVNITGAKLDLNTGKQGDFDLELQGTSQQISEGLKYLQSLDLKIISKPNPDGDSWYY